MSKMKMTEGEIAVLPENDGQVGLLIVANGGLTEEKDHGMVHFGRGGLSFEKVPGLSDFADMVNNGVQPQQLDDTRFMSFQRTLGAEPLVHAFAFPASSDGKHDDLTSLYAKVPTSVADSLGLEVNRLYAFDDVGVKLGDPVKLDERLVDKTLEDIISSVSMHSDGKTPVQPDISVAAKPGDLEAPPAEIAFEEEASSPSGP